MGEAGKSVSPWLAEGAVLGIVTVVLATFSFVVGDVVCDLVSNELLSLDAIVDFRLELSEHLYYLVKILNGEGRHLYLSSKTTKPPAKALTIISCCTLDLF